MSRKPVPVLFMSVMLVFMLASAGVAYGLWSQTLQILGTVTTDQLGAKWVIMSGSHAACELDPTDDTIVRVTINNAVPGEMGSCHLNLKNAGNITFKIVSDSLEEVPLGSWTIADGSDYFPGAPLNTNHGQVYVHYVNGVGLVLAPGDETATRLDFSVEDYAAQNTTYEFKVEVLVEQQ
jgi:hypothetical protein